MHSKYYITKKSECQTNVYVFPKIFWEIISFSTRVVCGKAEKPNAPTTEKGKTAAKTGIFEMPDEQEKGGSPSGSAAAALSRGVQCPFSRLFVRLQA